MSIIKKATIKKMTYLPEFFWCLPVFYRHKGNRKTIGVIRVPQYDLGYDIEFYNFELRFEDEVLEKDHMSYQDQIILTAQKPSDALWQVSNHYVDLSSLKVRKQVLESKSEAIKKDCLEKKQQQNNPRSIRVSNSFENEIILPF